MAIDTTQLVADAKALGSAVVADAKTAGESLLSAVAGDAEAKVPTFTSDAETLLLDLIPSAYRPVVQTVAAAPLASLDASAVAAIKTGVGIALTRIAAL